MFLCCGIRMYDWANSQGQIHFYLSAIDVSPTSHKSASARGTRCEVFSSLCVHARICVFACDCVGVNVCVFMRQKVNRFPREGFGEEKVSKLPRAVCREITRLYGGTHTHTLILFWQWFLAQLNLNLMSVQRATANRGFDKVVVLARMLHTPLPAGRMSGHLWWYHRTDRWHRTAHPILPSVIPLTDGKMKDIHQSKCLHTPNFVSQSTGARWILNTLWRRY